MNAATQFNFPTMPADKTYASFRVWKDSAKAEVRFAPLHSNRDQARRMASKLFHDARRFERQTRRHFRKQDGKLGRNAILVMHALIFDFLNLRTGRLDPSYESIAHKANISVRSVARGLAKLKECGVVKWFRRCQESVVNGRYCLEQESNAYYVCPSSQWKGFTPPPDAPTPERGTWGDHPPIVALDQAAETIRDGGTAQQKQRDLESDDADALAVSLAKLGRRQPFNI
jgi:hypothetical protein